VQGRAGGGATDLLILPCVNFMQGSNDAAEVIGSSQETPSRKTAENTVKHRNCGVGSVVANHRGGGKSSVVFTTLFTSFCSRIFSID